MCVYVLVYSQTQLVTITWKIHDLQFFKSKMQLNCTQAIILRPGHNTEYRLNLSNTQTYRKVVHSLTRSDSAQVETFEGQGGMLAGFVRYVSIFTNI